MLKAITLYEPYASMMRIHAKVNETRSTRTSHRGEIAIHSAKRSPAPPDEVIDKAIHAFHRRKMDPYFTHGQIICLVDIYQVRFSEDFVRHDLADVPAGMVHLPDEESYFGDYSPGRFIYRTRNLRVLKEPVPARGMQCVGWTVPEDIEKQVRAQL